MKDKKAKDNSLFNYYGFTKKDVKKYPVISRILKQLTPERMKKENEAIQRIKLPLELQKWVKEYEKVGERDEFLWRWAYRTFQILTYSSVVKKYQKPVKKIKFLILMFIVLLDDVSDKMKNKTLSNIILQIPSRGNDLKIAQTSQRETQYIEFAIKIWHYIEITIQKYPRYKEFKGVFDFDIIQMLNAMKYANLLNKNHYLINTVENWMYFSHNMQGMISCTVDLMCSPKLDVGEVGFIREITWYAQQMTRVGNWINTWGREVEENDFTSVIFAYAIKDNIIQSEDLAKNINTEKTIVRYSMSIREYTQSLP